MKIQSSTLKLHCEKDKGEAEAKAEMKLKKMKENTKLFNNIIENKMTTG